MNPYYSYKASFDLKHGAINSLERMNKNGGSSRYEFFIETTRNQNDPDEWIIAIYKDHKYVMVCKVRDMKGNIAAEMHWKYVRKIKQNGYKLDGIIN